MPQSELAAGNDWICTCRDAVACSLYNSAEPRQRRTRVFTNTTVVPQFQAIAQVSAFHPCRSSVSFFARLLVSREYYSAAQ
jgi:hypothetical protein